MDIKWEDPPTAQRGPGSTPPEEFEFAQGLRNDPDRWARFLDCEKQARAAAVAKMIRNGKRAAFRLESGETGEFDAVSRKVKGTNVTAVYVRYATLNND